MGINPSIAIFGGDGDDTLILDFSGGNPIPSGGIEFHGGESTGDDDRLILTGGSTVATVNIAHTGSEAGSVTLGGLGTVTFSEIEPLFVDVPMADLVITLPAGPNADTTLGDDGVSPFDGTNDAGKSAIYDSTSPYSFEYTEFTNPTNSLTINRGSASDNLTVLDLVASGLNSSITIGAAGSEFNQVTFSGPVTLASGKSLAVNASGTISLPNTTSDLATSGPGTVTLTTAQNISLASGSSITTVDGSITLAANTAGTTGGSFLGIDIDGGTVQTAGAGNLQLTATGGTSGSSQSGVVVRNGGMVTATGTSSGNIELIGTGGTGSSDNDGVVIIGTNAVTSSGSGNITLTGTQGDPTGGISEGISFGTNGTVSTTAGSGQVFLIADIMTWPTSSTVISAGTRSVTLRQKTNGVALNLGTTSTTSFGLSDPQLDRITAGTINIGDSNSGAITISATIDLTDGPVVPVLQLITGSNILETNPGTPDLKVATLAMTASTGIGMAGTPINTSISSNLEAESSTGGVFINNPNQVFIGGASGALSGLRAITSGDVVLTSTSNINLLASETIFAGNGTITLLGDDLLLAGTSSVNAGANAVNIQTTTSRPINLGNGTVGGSMNLSDAELDLITAGTLRIGTSSSGAITVTDNITPALTGVLSLRSGGAITDTSGGLDVPNLAVRGSSVVLDHASTDVTNLAGTSTGAGGVFTFVNRTTGGDLNINSVDTEVGITTNNGAITITVQDAANALAVTAGDPINSGGASIALTADALDVAATVSASGNTVTLKQFTNSTAITLGTEVGGQLSLTDTELDLITADKLIVGDSSSGAITVTAAIDLTDGPVVPILHLISGSNILDSNASDPDLKVASLALEAAGGIGSGTTLETQVTNLAAVSTAGSSASIQITNSGSLTITTVDGVTGVQKTGGTGNITVIASSPLTVSSPVIDSVGGDITLTATDDGATLPEPDDLTINAQVQASGGSGNIALNGENLIINDTGVANDVQNAGTGTITANISKTTTINASTTVVSAGGDITFNTDEMVINTTSGTINSSTGTTTIRPTTAGGVVSIDLGSNPGTVNVLELSDAELDRITAGKLFLGSAGSGAITITADISRASGILSLQSGSTVSENSGADLTVTGNSLAVRAGGAITLDQGNSVTNFAATTSSGGITYVESSAGGAVSINDVDGVFGVSTNNGPISISTTDGSLTVTNTSAANDVDAGNSTVSLTAGQTGGTARTLTMNNNSVVRGTGGVTFIANKMDIGTTGTSINAGSATATLRNEDTGVAINLGSTVDTTANTVELSDAELDRITAGTISIGNSSTGNITVSSAISPALAANLTVTNNAANSLTVNATVTVSGTFSGQVTTANLNANISATTITGTATTVNVDDNPSGQIQDGIDIAASGATVNVAAGSYTETVNVNKGLTLKPGGNSAAVVNLTGSLTFSATGSTLAVDVNGNTPGTDQDQINASSTVDLGSGKVALSVSSSMAFSVLSTFDILTSGSGPVLGTFTNVGNTAIAGPNTFFISYNPGSNLVRLVVANGNPGLIYVDDDWASFVNGQYIADMDPLGPVVPGYFNINAFSTIQGGVDKVSSAGTVEVNPHATAYAENVSIAKALTLDGNGGAGGTTATAVVIDPMAGVGIAITAGGDNVTIRDLRVTDASDGINASGVSTLTLNNVQSDTNSDDGIDLSTLTGTTTITNLVANDNGDDGLVGSSLGAVNISGGTFNNNTGDGISLTSVGAVTTTNVTATGNDPGIFISGAPSYSDTDGTFSNNDNHGIQLEDISGNVMLIRTVADNNDADDDGFGDGLNATDGGDVDSVAIGGDLLVQGARFRDSGGVNDHQEHGVFVASVGGSVTFEDSTGVVQSVIVTGNEIEGVRIDSGTTATFTNGTYSSNDNDGIELTSFSGMIAVTTVTASNNGSDGFDFLTVGDVIFTGGVTATGNVGAGALIVDALSFADTDGTYSNNEDDGIALGDIVNDVTLIRTVADNNNADNGSGGDGLYAFEDSGFVLAIGGDLLIQGGRFRDTGGMTDHQLFGIEVESIDGSVTLESSVVGMVTTAMEVTGNEQGGVAIAGAFPFGATTATLIGGTYSDNDGDGITLVAFFGGVTATGVTASNNHAGPVSTGTGLLVIFAGSFSDTDGVYQNNDDDGVAVGDIFGDVTLIRTIAENNNANNTDDDADLFGDNGFNAFEATGSFDAIGGNLLIQGGSFRDTGGMNDHQNFGIFVESVGGNVTLQDSTGVVQAVQVTGNEVGGVSIGSVGGSAAFTSATTANFDNNGGDGIFVGSLTGTLTISKITANGNAGDGLDIADGGTTASISSSTFSSNTPGNGLLLNSFSGTVTITNVTASSNSADGLHATGLPLAVSGGNYNGNGSDGIQLGTGVTGTISGVSASNNTVNGLSITAGGAITIAGSTFNNNPTGILVTNGGITFGAGNSIGGTYTTGLLMTGSNCFVGGNTLNNTAFGPTAGKFITLTNQALFGPQIITATAATFDLGSGPKIGAALTPTELDNLELQVDHYPDDNLVGLLIFRYNYADIDNNNLLVIGSDVANNIQVNALNPANVLVTIGGLPILNPAGGPFDMSSGLGRVIIFGLSGNDFIQLSTAASGLILNGELHGGLGNDTMNGGAGHDVLYGEEGNDSLVGGAGNDVLVGGAGRDTLSGGAGEDVLISGRITDAVVNSYNYLRNTVSAMWVGSKTLVPIQGFIDDANVLNEYDMLSGGANQDGFIANYLGGGLMDLITDFGVGGAEQRLDVPPP